jgi:branched-chain amino acid transport system ATP-binding protein
VSALPVAPAAAASAALAVDRLTVAYGGIIALREVSFQVGAGEAVALLGPNGAGKTSCVEAIAGLVAKRGGAVSFFGRDIARQSASAIARQGLALVPQWRELFPNFSVAETLAAGVHTAIDRPTRPLEEIFDLFPVLAERRKQKAGSLSGGEQQMLAIARALVGNPRLILLDEPSAGLAVGIVGSLIQTICRIRDSGVSILLVEQNVDIATAVAERCCILSAGEMIWQGDLATAVGDGTLQRAYFGAHG